MAELTPLWLVPHSLLVIQELLALLGGNYSVSEAPGKFGERDPEKVSALSILKLFDGLDLVTEKN